MPVLSALPTRTDTLFIQTYISDKHILNQHTGLHNAPKHDNNKYETLPASPYFSISSSIHSTLSGTSVRPVTFLFCARRYSGMKRTCTLVN